MANPAAWVGKRRRAEDCAPYRHDNRVKMHPIVNRSTLLKEVDTDTASLMQQVADLDDLVQQFDSTDAGKRFIEARKRARIIVNIGGGHSNGGTPPTPPTPPATPKP